MTDAPLEWIPVAIFGAIVVATVCSLFLGPRQPRRPSDAPAQEKASDDVVAKHGQGL